MTSLLAARTPLAACGAALALAFVAAAVPYYSGFPAQRLRHWEDVPALAAVAVFIAFAGFTAAAQAWRALRGATILRDPDAGAARCAAPPFRHADTVAALVLALLVGLEGAAHLGPNTGYWATGRPRFGDDVIPADGYVVWLDGQPLPSDSAPFLRDYNLLARTPGSADPWVALPGRAVYPFLVALVAPFVAPLVGVYGAFVAVNWACWWLGAVATAALARRATRSWWAGAVAGVLVASGLGFTFMAGGGTSHAAAYGLVPVILWLAERLAIFRSDTPWRCLAFHAVCTAAAGLTYSLAPFFLTAAVLYRTGRAPLSRVAAWCALTLATGQVWAIVSSALLSAPTTALLSSGATALVVTVVMVGLVAVAAAVPARTSERAVAAAILLGIGAAVLAAGMFRSHFVAPASLLAALQVPGYYVERLLRGVNELSQAVLDPHGLLRLTHTGIVASHFPTAFPPALWALAAAGLVTLRPRWRDWALSQLVGMTVFAGVAALVGAGVHPRLSYAAYPAVYVLAAAGLTWLSSLPAALVRAGGSSKHGAAAAVRAAVCICGLALLAYPANASLLGNPYFDLRFHGLSP